MGPSPPSGLPRAAEKRLPSIPEKATLSLAERGLIQGASAPFLLRRKRPLYGERRPERSFGDDEPVRVATNTDPGPLMPEWSLLPTARQCLQGADDAPFVVCPAPPGKMRRES